MESTPHQPPTKDFSEDSGCLTSSFDASCLYVSTPVRSQSTPSNRSHKRKLTFEPPNKKLADILETCPAPQFSSTLNESLVCDLEKCNITSIVDGLGETSFKKFKSNTGKSEAISPPVTPVKKEEMGYVAPVNSDSPYKQTIEILYPQKPVVEPRKGTPLKLGAVKRDFASKRSVKEKVDPMVYFQGKYLILEKVFGFLSDGDIYRVSMVSQSWHRALIQEPKAYNRYRTFLKGHKTNKENYTYTPPESPKSPESPPVSPDRVTFNRYVKLAKTLTSKQSLHRCVACQDPAIVEHDIAQCQNPTCGYIRCLRCSSFSKTGPADFSDSCRGLRAEYQPPKRSITRLSDLSNSPTGQAGMDTSSGYFSVSESPAFVVKRNLDFSGCGTRLSECNRNVVVKSTVKRKSGTLLLVEGGARRKEDKSPSPQPERPYVACSKQSKKNLKRLLF